MFVGMVTVACKCCITFDENQSKNYFSLYYSVSKTSIMQTRQWLQNRLWIFILFETLFDHLLL